MAHFDNPKDLLNQKCKSLVIRSSRFGSVLLNLEIAIKAINNLGSTVEIMYISCGILLSLLCACMIILDF